MPEPEPEFLQLDDRRAVPSMLLPMQSGSGSEATSLSLLGSYTERRPRDSTLWKRLQEAEQRHATSEKAAAAVVQRPSKAVAAAGLESALEEQSRLAAARHAGANVLTKRQQRQLEMNRRYARAHTHTASLSRCLCLSLSLSVSHSVFVCRLGFVDDSSALAMAAGMEADGSAPLPLSEAPVGGWVRGGRRRVMPKAIPRQHFGDEGTTSTRAVSLCVASHHSNAVPGINSLILPGAMLFGARRDSEVRGGQHWPFEDWD